MKNERIHELDKRLILMETVVRGWQRLVGDGGGGQLMLLLSGHFLCQVCPGKVL